jgi:hypothetical protein
MRRSVMLAFIQLQSKRRELFAFIVGVIVGSSVLFLITNKESLFDRTGIPVPLDVRHVSLLVARCLLKCLARGLGTVSQPISQLEGLPFTHIVVPFRRSMII